MIKVIAAINKLFKKAHKSKTNFYTVRSLKLYDYVDKGTLVGEVNNTLYLVFSKGDKYLNYEEYLK